MTRRQQPLKHGAIEKLYPRYWHSYTEYVRKDGQDLCYVCEKPATGYSEMNVWGTVCDVRTCDMCHAIWNHKCVETLPRLSDQEIRERDIVDRADLCQLIED